MVFFNTNRKCSVCLRESEDPSFDIPGMRFGGLEGDPFVCDRCFALLLGIEATWKSEIETKLKKDENSGEYI